MAEIEITLPDGSTRALPSGTTAADLARDIGSGLANAAVIADINGEERDLSAELHDGDRVALIKADSPRGLYTIRHSTAHVLAQAVLDLFPDASFGIGPPVDDGFYYDFLLPGGATFTPEDLERIDMRMREIIDERQAFLRDEIPADDARQIFADHPLKLEIIADASTDPMSATSGAGAVRTYENPPAKPKEHPPFRGRPGFIDLCRGPHVEDTGRHLGHFKLIRVAGAYWRGDEHNPQLQRIYGTAWDSDKALEAHLHQLEEAAKRDHRKLGVELDLFHFPPEIGSGLPVYHPKGGIIRRVMEDYSRRRHIEAGYEFVNTPHITKSDLFETSGHLEWYADSMYPPMELEGARYYPKPMNCPMHILIYSARGRSYRELPLRLFEFGTVYRFEKSGVVHGLTRARGFTQDDAHIFCAPEQLAEELASLLDFVVGLLRDFGLTEFEAELSTRPEKFVGEPEEWEQAEAALKHALDVSGLPYVIAEGEGAFYAPKIDVHVRDAIGRRWQLSTLQVDFQEPGRFGIEYTAPDGSRRRPYMIHRALFGSIDRFFGILVEHYAGAFPPWLAPVQVTGIPIADAHVAYLQKVAAKLREHGIRVEVDDGADRMQKKIRNAQRQKVPYMLLAGDDDVAAGAVSFRYRNGEQKNGVPVDEAVAEIVAAVADHVQV
jgi:threonyl-tRNA synthetase